MGRGSNKPKKNHQKEEDKRVANSKGEERANICVYINGALDVGRG